MSANSTIEWTEKTWNPVRGCSVISPGCHSCYAMKIAHRFSGPGKPYAGLTMVGASGPIWNGQIRVVDEAIEAPLSWRKPSRAFVDSMSDLFHAGVPRATLDRLFAVMAISQRHTFQILTKRADRMEAYMMTAEARVRNAILSLVGVRGRGQFGVERSIVVPFLQTVRWPLPNVWLGVSIENQRFAASRVPSLLRTLAAVRFVSAEPLLGEINLRSLRTAPTTVLNALDGWEVLEEVPARGPWLDWVIVGGESGLGARHCSLQWIRSLVSQCEEHRVPCFVKQLGSNVGRSLFDDAPITDPKGGNMDEWPADVRIRNFPPAHEGDGVPSIR